MDDLFWYHDDNGDYKNKKSVVHIDTKEVELPTAIKLIPQIQKKEVTQFK